MASFFDEIAANRLKSLVLFGAFTLLFLGITYLFILIFGGGPFTLAIGLVLIIIYGALVYFFGDRAVLAISRAKEADRKQYPALYETVEGLSAAAQVPMPKVYIINDPNPNAFATGKNKKASSIAVTSGLLGMMNRQELQGVLAHEMSHIYNNDILFMMVAVVFAGAIGIVSAVVRNLFFFGGIGGRSRNGGMLLLVALVIGMLAPIFALLLRLAISRRREYMADANGARMIRDPGALASALKKVQGYSANPQAKSMANANEMTASLYFSSPFRGASVMNIFSTHPPIEERIKRLQAMY